MRTRTTAPRWRGAVLGLAALVGMATGSIGFTAAAEAATVTYTATQTFAPPPAIAYGGTAGGDGWAVALTGASVYNVYHHLESTIVACHHQLDATSCWGPKTITDGSGGQFSTASHTGLWINKATGRLYLYGTRHADLTGGVVCFDTAAADAGGNPFCGFTALTAAGESPEQQQAGVGGGPDQTMSAISEPVSIGGKWYAFNYVPGAPAATSSGVGGRNALLCFDQTTLAACSGQPYPVGLGAGAISDTFYPVPPVAGVAGRVLVPATVTAGAQLACFDPATGAVCAGSWPIALTDPYIGVDGPAFPLLAATGAATGFCLPTEAMPCFGTAGASVPTPAGLAAAFPKNTRWNGNAVTVGTRVYLPVGRRVNSAGAVTVPDEVACYDAATAAGCAGFPKVMSGLEELYTVNEDPYRPTCLWVNADTGSGSQIQNFDAFTGAACFGPSRVVGADIVVPSVACKPAAFTTLQVTAPTRSTYTKGNVTVLDGTGAELPGGTGLTLDASGGVSLAGLHPSDHRAAAVPDQARRGRHDALADRQGQLDRDRRPDVPQARHHVDQPVRRRQRFWPPPRPRGRRHRRRHRRSRHRRSRHRRSRHRRSRHRRSRHRRSRAGLHHTGHPGPAEGSGQGHHAKQSKPQQPTRHVSSQGQAHQQSQGPVVRPPCVAGYQKRISVPGW